MKIVDNFLFHNEYDLLELRFKQHYDHVDRFVISECDHTFSGIYKGFNLDLHKERFAPWWDKVVHLKLTDPPKGSAWAIEFWQRDCFSMGWNDLDENDVVIIADVDEFFRPETFEFIRKTTHKEYSLCMPTFYYRFNYMALDSHYPWVPMAFRGNRGKASEMRNRRDIPDRDVLKLHHAGWHFSWLGNTTTALDKLKSYSHTEYNIPSIVNNLNLNETILNGRDHMNRDLAWGPVKFDEYFPQVVRDNFMQYKDLIIPGGEKTVQEYWPYGILEVGN